MGATERQDDSLTAVHVIVRGRVQGVCYRMSTQLEAGRRGVRGWVKNCPDGSVEGVFEGPDSAVQDLVRWCRQGPSLARVTDVEVRPLPTLRRFEGFSIEH